MGRSIKPTTNEGRCALAGKAVAIWNRLNEMERSGVRYGELPHEPMREAELEGFNGSDLSLAIEQIAMGQEGRV